MEVKDIEIKKINVIENVRQRDVNQDVHELMDSIKQNGLLQPIGVSPLPNGKYDLVLGSRRMTACKKLGWSTIPAVIGDRLELKELIIRNTVENVQRENVSPAEEGRICYALMKDFDMTRSEIASRLGVALHRVTSSIEIFSRIPEKYRKLVIHHKPGTKKKGKIPASTANAILNMKRQLNKAQTEKMLEAARKDDFTSDHVKVVATLLSMGWNIDEAIKEARGLVVTSVKIVVSPKELQSKMRTAGYNNLNEYFASVLSGKCSRYITLPTYIKNQTQL